MKLKRKEFLAELAKLADSLRRTIEAECDGFSPDPDASRARRARVRDDFAFFRHTYFPHYCRYRDSVLHAWLDDILPALVDCPDGQRLACAAPRGEAKSTVVSLIFVLWCLLTERKRYVVLVPDAFEQAAALLEAVKVELEVNPRLVMDFAESTGQGRVWNVGVAITAGNAKIQAFGSGKRMRGLRHGPHRPDLVICDDLENDENVKSLEQRDKLQSWLQKTVLSLGEAGDTMDVILVGTVLHYDSVLSRLGHDAAGIVPDGMLIEFHEAARGSEKPFLAMHALCEMGASKAILGSTLTTDTKGVGSQALGEIHNEVRLDIRASDARQIAGTLTRQLLAPLAVLNEGVTDAGLLPRFVFDSHDPDDLETLANSLPKLSTVMRIPAAWAHERAGIPLPEDDEPVLGPAPGAKDQADQADAPPPVGTAALAAGTAGDAAAYPDQDAIDAATVPDATLAALARDLLAPLLAEADTRPEALIGRLAELYPKMDTTALEELCARVLFVGELWGRLAAQAEAGGD